MENDTSAGKGGRVPVGFFTADTPSRVIAQAILAAHAAAKKRAMEHDQTGLQDHKQKDAPLSSH